MPYDSISDRPNLLIVTDKNQSIAIDAGASKTHVEAFYKLLNQHQIPSPITTILTHWHWDHSFALPYIHGKSIAHINTQRHLENYSKLDWNEDTFYTQVEANENIVESFIASTMRIEYPDISQIKVICADKTFEDHFNLKVGNIELQLQHVPSPHGDDNVLIYIPQDKVLVIGDAICCDFFKRNECDLNRLKLLKESIQSYDFEIGLQGHCEPMSKAEILTQIQELRQETLENQ